MVMSPSVWWDRAVILKKLVSSAGSAGSVNSIWLDVGADEGASTLRNARRLRDVLRAGTALHPGGKGEWLRYVEDADGDHSERSWGRRFEAALTFLYPAGPKETA
jgi:predicted alpha/beta superfamily hydrolase